MGFLKLLLSGFLGFCLPLKTSGRAFLKRWVKDWSGKDPSTIPELAWDEFVEGCLQGAKDLRASTGQTEGLRTCFVEQLKGEGSLIVSLLSGSKEFEGTHTHRILVKYGVVK